MSKYKPNDYLCICYYASSIFCSKRVFSAYSESECLEKAEGFFKSWAMQIKSIDIFLYEGDELVPVSARHYPVLTVITDPGPGIKKEVL